MSAADQLEAHATELQLLIGMEADPDGTKFVLPVLRDLVEEDTGAPLWQLAVGLVTVVDRHLALHGLAPAEAPSTVLLGPLRELILRHALELIVDGVGELIAADGVDGLGQ